jgi:hypothetical protein
VAILLTESLSTVFEGSLTKNVLTNIAAERHEASREDARMTFADDHPGYEITTEQEARNWVIELVDDVESARLSCNVVIPDDQAKTVRHQQRAYTKFMVKHGSALGVVMALHRCRKISDVAYNELRQRVIQTLVPTVVGRAGEANVQ